MLKKQNTTKCLPQNKQTSKKHPKHPTTIQLKPSPLALNELHGKEQNEVKLPSVF